MPNGNRCACNSASCNPHSGGATSHRVYTRRQTAKGHNPQSDPSHSKKTHGSATQSPTEPNGNCAQSQYAQRDGSQCHHAAAHHTNGQDPCRNIANGKNPLGPASAP
ncbi:MAG: hypothetical protein KHX25_05510, partial [Firmicutes bacterium]|nr:hypothetical protein [Bacillota bacterium]